MSVAGMLVPELRAVREQLDSRERLGVMPSTIKMGSVESQQRFRPLEQSILPTSQTAAVRMRAVDWAAVLLCAFEMSSVLFSSYRANSIPSIEPIMSAVLVYFAIRFIFRTRLQVSLLAGVLGIAGAWASFLAVREFSRVADRLEEAGLTNLLAFRSDLMHPIPGWLPGECFTALLLALPFACAPAVYLWRKGSVTSSKVYATLVFFPAVMIVGALCLSLSRAVFWSAVLFFFVTCALVVGYRVISLKVGAVLLAGSLAGLLLVLACASALYPGIFRAYARDQTSQVRSTHGRLDIWARSLDIVRAHPFLGVGSSNAALFLLSTTDLEDTTGFASRSFSLPIQILVEKGITGFALYATFLFVVGLEFHRSMRAGTADEGETRRMSKRAMRDRERIEMQVSGYKAMKCCFAAGLIAVLFRELTYSSLFEHTLTLVLAFMLAALACGRESAAA